MIHFQDTTEKKTTPELSGAAGFREIKPSGGLSFQGARSFLDRLFSGGSSRWENVDRESLMQEIYGRSTDEFSFEFEWDDRVQGALDRFRPDQWEKLSHGEKVGAIREFAGVIGEKLGLKDQPEIRLYSDVPNSCGAYYAGENVVRINQNIFFDPREVADTVAHEFRHAYQHQRANHPETKMDMLYKLNFENYVSATRQPDGTYLHFTDYQDQLVEAEARAFASLFTGQEDM